MGKKGEKKKRNENKRKKKLKGNAEIVFSSVRAALCYMCS